MQGDGVIFFDFGGKGGKDVMPEMVECLFAGACGWTQGHVFGDGFVKCINCGSPSNHGVRQKICVSHRCRKGLVA